MTRSNPLTVNKIHLIIKNQSKTLTTSKKQRRRKETTRHKLVMIWREKPISLIARTKRNNLKRLIATQFPSMNLNMLISPSKREERTLKTRKLVITSLKEKASYMTLVNNFQAKINNKLIISRSNQLQSKTSVILRLNLKNYIG